MQDKLTGDLFRQKTNDP